MGVTTLCSTIVLYSVVKECPLVKECPSPSFGSVSCIGSNECPPVSQVVRYLGVYVGLTVLNNFWLNAAEEVQHKGITIHMHVL